MEYASKLWSDMNKTGTVPLRRACTFFAGMFYCNHDQFCYDDAKRRLKKPRMICALPYMEPSLKIMLIHLKYTTY